MVYTTTEAYNKISINFESVKKSACLDYSKSNHFENIGKDMAVMFARKEISTNSSHEPHSLVFTDRKGFSIHCPKTALISRIETWFDIKFNQKKLDIKNLRYKMQFDNTFYWLLVVDKKTQNCLVFENI